MKGRTLAVAAALLVSIAVAPSSAAGAPPTLGITGTTLIDKYSPPAYPAHPSNEAVVAKAAELGSETGVPTRIWRMQLEWKRVKPMQGEPFNWDFYTPIYDALLDQGIKPLWILMGAPEWAEDPLDLCPFARGSGPCPPADNRLPQWRAFVREAVKEFPESAGIEVWNEPNFRAFWPTLEGPNAARYMGVLAAAYNGVQEAEAELAPSMPPGWEMPVLLGGPAGNPSEYNGIPRNQWLERIYALQGESHYFDVLSTHIHPKPQNVRPDEADYSLLGELEEMAQRRDNLGDPSTPIWVTEFGYHTRGCDGAHGCPVALEDQGPFLRCAYGLVIDSPYNVGAFLINTLADFPGEGTDTKRSWGLLTSWLEPKIEEPPGIDGYSVLQSYFSTVPSRVTDCA